MRVIRITVKPQSTQPKSHPREVAEEVVADVDAVVAGAGVDRNLAAVTAEIETAGEAAAVKALILVLVRATEEDKRFPGWSEIAISRSHSWASRIFESSPL
jgi:hypothetical protein